MEPKKRWNRWQITYRIPGYDKLYSEHFDTIEEANIRIAEIEYKRPRGLLKPPERVQKSRFISVGDFLDEYVSRYGVLHWGDSYYSVSVHRINDYIKPGIGHMLLKDVTTRDLDEFYSTLLETPAVILPGHKDTTKTVSYSVIDKINDLIRSAMTQAIKWGYISFNPAIAATIPKGPSKPREVWSPEDAKRALSVCTDQNLKVAMLLAIGCSLRVGEILGLQWENVHISETSLQDNSSVLDVKQELKRCDKTTLKVLEEKKRSNVYFTFPETKPNCRTSLVLKSPKTESSVRSVYIPNTVATALRDLKKQQERRIQELHGLYQNYDMVIAQADGRPTEERLIARALKLLEQENNLPEVVFHSLRHLSTSMKLQVSGGDIKAVQGDTGHSQASMVTNVYAHTFDENRKRIADRMESSFFEATVPEKRDANPERDQILSLLAEKPELAALILAMAK
ncbi:MAG: site-specific integrase [Oscillospiraceae bacterium]|nr:site-specific integrase [Oscillospiraceae bacterium]